MTTEDKIQQAAETSAKEATKGLTILPGEQWKMYLEGHLDGFKSGSDYVLKHPELMKEEILEFISWREKWQMRLDYQDQKTHSDEELFTLYIEHLNKQA